jgi:hypothetical protein
MEITKCSVIFLLRGDQMKNASMSIKYFGMYLIWLGVAIVSGVNLAKDVLQIPDLPNSWLRFIGLLVFCLGIYYVTAARNGWVIFYKTTVGLRLLVVAFLVLHVAIGEFPMIFLLLSAIDLLGAIWTFISVKRMGSFSV